MTHVVKQEMIIPCAVRLSAENSILGHETMIMW